MNKSDILEVQIVQREFDKRWERVVKVHDHENAYYHQNENGVMETLTPTKWLTTNVYDFILEEAA